MRADLDSGKHKTVVTRFPPEPNGYLHIGHAKSICLNFGIAEEFSGHCNLRYDDNQSDQLRSRSEYIDAIERDVHWLGFDWGKNLYHASDYFEQIYTWAEDLIRRRQGLCRRSDPGSRCGRRAADADRAGQERVRSCDRPLVEENLDLFRRRRAGELLGSRGCCAPRSTWRPATSICAIRCSIASCIAEHPRNRQDLGASIRATTPAPRPVRRHRGHHALDLRALLESGGSHWPLYDWFLANLPVPSHPHQHEFARLNLTYTVLSKRVLTELWRAAASVRRHGD